MQYKRLDDQANNGALPAPAADFTPLLGNWVNTNPATHHIAQLQVDKQADALQLNVFGSGKPTLQDWGATAAQGFVSSVSGSEGIGFTADYDFGFMETRLCSNHSKGVLVIQSYNHFKDDSGRGDYFSREFFRRAAAGGNGAGHV